MTKYNIEYVRDFFAQNGYKLLTDHYKNSHQVLDYICPKGTTGKVKWYHFKDGGRCPCCRGNAKISHEEAKAYFDENGCKMIGVFVSTLVPVEYICNCGRKSKIRWYQFKKGGRCRGCYPSRSSGPGNPRWNPDREKVLMTKKLASAAHTALKSTLQYLGKRKDFKTYEILGYSGEDLKQSIENHPNWNSVKDKNWSLDHVFPIKAFIDYGIVDVRIINSLDNLQPMILKENQSKSKSYSKVDFEKWLENKKAVMK